MIEKLDENTETTKIKIPPAQVLGSVCVDGN